MTVRGWTTLRERYAPVAQAEVSLGEELSERERSHWKDRGCSVSPSCFTCPLDQCRYDVQGGLRAIQNRSRNAAIVEAFKGGQSIKSIATDFGIHQRTVFTVVRGIKSARRRKVRLHV